MTKSKVQQGSGGANWSRRAIFGCLVGIVLAGCGGPDTGGRLGLSGTVTLKGQPLANGTIEFCTAEGGALTGGVIEAGKYSIPAVSGLMPGKYLVRISSVQDTSGPPGPPGTESERPQVTDLIPEEYNAKSTLTAEVTAGGKNEFPFAIP